MNKFKAFYAKYRQQILKLNDGIQATFIIALNILPESKLRTYLGLAFGILYGFSTARYYLPKK